MVVSATGLAYRREDGILAVPLGCLELWFPGPRYLTHAALDNALAIRNYCIDDAFVLAETNVRVEGLIAFLPLYMARILK